MAQGSLLPWERVGLVRLVLAVVVVAGVLVVRGMRSALRSWRLARFAARNGYRFYRGAFDVTTRWPEHTCLGIGANGRAVGMVEGERHGRRFAAFHYRYEFDGAEIGGAKPAREGCISAVVVECRIPAEAPTAAATRGFAPWRVAAGTSSLVAWHDGSVPPAEFAAVIDELNAALDLIVNDAAHAA